MLTIEDKESLHSRRVISFVLDLNKTEEKKH